MCHKAKGHKSKHGLLSVGAIVLVCAGLLLPVCALSQTASPSDIRIILLGTGGPELTRERQGTATLVQAAGQTLLFDAGRGTLQRLYEDRVDIARVNKIFLTHLHSDHFEGLPELWMTGWFLLGRPVPIEIWGPVGTQQMVYGMLRMYGHDVALRVGASARSNMTQIRVHEFTQGSIYEQDGLKVAAFPVEHEDGNPAVGFKITLGRHAIVLGGDTTYSPNVVEAGRGADVLVSNVIAASDAYLVQAPAKRAVMSKLTTPEQAARIFMQAKPKLAVYTHVIRLGLTDQQILDQTRAAGYTGPLTMGEDRMSICVGENITVQPPSSLDRLLDVTRPGEP